MEKPYYLLVLLLCSSLSLHSMDAAEGELSDGASTEALCGDYAKPFNDIFILSLSTKIDDTNKATVFAESIAIESGTVEVLSHLCTKADYTVDNPKCLEDVISILRKIALAIKFDEIHLICGKNSAPLGDLLALVIQAIDSDIESIKTKEAIAYDIDGCEVKASKNTRFTKAWQTALTATSAITRIQAAQTPIIIHSTGSTNQHFCFSRE